MLHQVSEKTMHRVRWLLVIGWLVLIASLFYDPMTPGFTDPKNLSSPFHVNVHQCIKLRETCLPQVKFSMSALIWWAMIVPCGIFILLVFGHEFWRRICPLSFLSQIPRALGIQRRRKIVDRTTGEVRREVVTISEQSWLGRNHLYVQFGLFVFGLGLRILYVNSDRTALGSFLLITIVCAIVIGYLYAGKSWCQYFCPMAPVQMVYTGPRSLFGSQNYLKPTAIATQSMCRTVNRETDQEQSACVGCKAACIDIDAEKSYWTELNKPGRRLVQYGYLGMVIAFYLYYFLYAGNWDYYFTGAWTHEADQVANVLDTGFYLYQHAIPIPKAVAVFITFAVLIAITFTLGVILEKLCRRLPGAKSSKEQAQHVAFTIFTIASFWTFFSYGARPSLNRLPTYPLLAFNALIVLVGSLWLYRTLRRTRSQYERENLAISLRKQLQRLPIDQRLLEGRSIDDLTPDEIYTLVKVLQGVSQQVRLQTYSEVVLDLLRQQTVTASGSFEFCRQLRQELQVTDTEHFSTIEAIALNSPELLSTGQAPVSEIHTATTVARAIVRPAKRFNP
ncbi:hypothetical protein IQ250_01865 [Pseudanabaenaceae cyanobacterium LEGE 13415]|nr:hypothetical protein [Pseudanabaenaceae cyanobacterium LEGE 13415]